MTPTLCQILAQPRAAHVEKTGTQFIQALPKFSAKAFCCLLNSNWVDGHTSIISVHWTVTSLPF